MTKATPFREQSEDDLKALLQEKQKERFLIKNQMQKEKKLDKPHLLKSTRKDIARILTVLSEKEGKR